MLADPATVAPNFSATAPTAEPVTPENGYFGRVTPLTDDTLSTTATSFQPVATAPTKTANPVARHGDEPDAAVIAQAKKVARLGRMALRACERVFDLEEQVDTRMTKVGVGGASPSCERQAPTSGSCLMARAHEPDPIFLPDEEIARRVSMTAPQWEAAAIVLERSGLPKRDPLFNQQRCWPAVRAFLFRRTGHAEQDGDTQGVVEDLNALGSPRGRRARS